jgi:hypothetical protein
MVTNEQQLIDVFDTCGFNFTSNACEIALRFPNELDWGVARFEVLPFRLNRAFAGLGSDWKIPVNRELEFDLPPTRYNHEFHPSGDVRENFDTAVAQLTELLGQGDTGKSTNVYERCWQVGFFKIQVISWPRNLNKTLGPNRFEGRNPYLWLSANVYIKPAFPYILPDEDATAPMKELILPSKSYRLICESVVYARRNLFLAPTGTIVAGLVPGAFLIRTENRSVRIPIDQIQRVVHTRLTPGRFPGSSSISLDTKFLNRHQVSVSVAVGAETLSLDQVASHLALAVARPLHVEEYPNDG